MEEKLFVKNFDTSKKIEQTEIHTANLQLRRLGP